MSGQGGDHAAAMDGVYGGFQRHIYDLTRKYYLLGRDPMLKSLGPPPGGSVIEVGCGTARNLVVAARAAPNARYFGFDISEAMLETARGNVAKAGLAGKITLAQGDATTFDPAALFGIAAADRVFMSYTLSMIPDWVGAIEQAARAVAPGGGLHIVDFGQQEQLPGPWRKALFAWLDQFHVTPRRELPAVLKRVAQAQGLSLDFRALYRGYAWAATLKRA